MSVLTYRDAAAWLDATRVHVVAAQKMGTSTVSIDPLMLHALLDAYETMHDALTHKSLLDQARQAAETCLVACLKKEAIA